MDSAMIRDMILNASLLLTISIIYNSLFIRKQKAKRLFSVLMGAIIGFVGILLMINAVTVASGIIFDTRSILLAATGMFFGFIPTVTAVLIIGAYRIFLGGAGAFAGVLVTLLTAAIGLIWHQFRVPRILAKRKYSILEFYLFGLVTHITMLACMFALPLDSVFNVLKEITLPVLLIYPAATLLLCIVIFNGFRNEQTSLNLAKSELHFRTIFEQSPIGIVIANNHQILYVNRMFQTILGRAKEEIIASDWADYTHPDDLEEDRRQFESMLEGKIDGYAMVKRYLKPDGTIVWVNMMIAALKVEGQQIRDHLCMIQDMTHMIESKSRLEKSEENYKRLFHEYQEKQLLLESLLNSIPDLIFYKDLDGVYLGCNQAFEKFVGLERNKIVAHTDFDIFPQEVASMFREMDQIMIEQKSFRKNEELVSYPDGSKVTLETLKTPFYDPQGEVVGLIGISRDISDRKRKEEEILYLNYHDVLTDLYNRTYFDEASKRLDTPAMLPLSIIIGDINGLKLINDVFGHAEGDKLLVEISNILKTCCNAGEVIARTGGDEFSILLPRTDNAATKTIFDQIKKACEEYATKSGEEVYNTSISLGYATKTAAEESFNDIVKKAEENMYRRKLLESRSLHSSIISSIRTTMFEKSDETEKHAERLANLSKRLGRAMGLSEEDLVSLELVSTLHDIGKISVDQNILNKSGKLSAEEWVELKKHPEVGYRIAQTVPELRRISEYILSHHERWDGEGYPQKLDGENIPLLSRILSIVDAFDAMTQNRAYRKAMSKEKAIEEILLNAGTQFDPNIAEIFIHQVLENLDS